MNILLIMYTSTKNSNGITKNGIATLPTVIVIGMMALAVAVSITAMSFNELLISQGSAQSSSALFYAEAGARDALTRIARNKNYTCSSADCYTIDFIANGCANGTDCAKVTVSAGVGTTADPKIITSKGVMKATMRRMQVSVVLDGGGGAGNGAITATSWAELTN
jgi:hypothetical protein